MEQLLTTMSPPAAQGTPLSSGQMRLWFLDQMDPVDSPYNSIHEIDFGCRVDPETLRTAISKIIQRHEILRTHFQVMADGVVQVIDPSFEAELPILDVQDLPSDERLERVKVEISELCQRPFDLRRLPLFRTLLVRSAPDKDVLLVQLHHIIADGQSSLVLLKELSAIYHAGRLGRSSAEALPPLPVQYSDYALWEQGWLPSKASTKQLSYWREQLKDLPPPLELPADELDAESPNAGVVSFELPEPIVRELRRLVRQEKVTLFMFLLAAFQSLLYRYTGGSDIIVGSPVGGRIRPEFENLIGFFVNTVALRTRIVGEETFRDLLTRVRATCLRAYGNQEFPFDRIVEELHPDRGGDSTPIFRVMLSLNRVSTAPVESNNWSFKSLATEDQRPQLDLLLAFFETESEISGMLTYRSSNFRRATMERLAGHFKEFLRQICANIETSIDAVKILTEGERRTLLYDLNGTEFVYPAGKCLHELFEDQVERAPEATALVYGSRRIDYRELDQKASRLASHLQNLGVGPEVRVGICLKRSPEIVVSILAVLKAGGAYVPLDPAYPAERLAFMAADSELKVLIASRVIPQSLSEQVVRSGSRIVAVDDESTWNSEPLSSLPVARRTVPANLAYIIYTSGSTGVPKGVSIEHRNAVNFVCWALSVFPPTDLAHTVASTSLCFDLSIFEIFAPLSCGGEILLVENALELSAEIGERQVSIINTVPSVMQELLFLGNLPSFRTLNLAGEPFTGTLLQKIREANLATKVFNLYGPSETTTYSSFACAGDDVNRAVPIGRPVGNTQCYVLDRLAEPVPIGVAGELYIGGEGVSRGYLQRPELTAERFLPDPFARAAGQRLYRTGDLARYRASGELEFMGRIDHQVKIRGFRIELGEIEAVLRHHESVREAIVIARQEIDGDKRLVAYIVREQKEESVNVADDQLDPATGALRRYLNKKLPSHMIPSSLIFLDSLPRTPNGKIDRDRLPEPDRSHTGNTKLYMAPRTSTEQMIADIWSEFLFPQQISVDQTFFELGGHSLLAARVILRMREVFGIEIPFRLIFEHPEISSLARQLSAGPDRAFQSVPLEGEERKGRGEELGGSYVFPASAGQQRLWFLHELSAGSGVAYHVCGGLKLEGAVQREAMGESLNRVVARQESLRTRLALVEGELSQIIVPELRLEMGYEDVRGPAGERRLAEITAEVAKRGFDLRRGPLLRASLVRLEDEVYQLLIAAHHIICDGWSVNVFIGDLMEEYRGLVEGDGSRLEELPIQYADYAVWQRRWLESSEAEWEMEYWKEKLKGEAPLVNLPRDGVRPAMQSFRGGSEEVVLGRELGERLRQRGRAAGATMYMTLLSGFTVLLHKYGGQRDLWVGTPVANRQRRELEGLVGFFVNTLVLRTEVAPELSFAEVLQRVRETVGGAYGHQQLPFEKLVQQLHPQPQLSTTPLFQVMFAVEEEVGIGIKTGPCGLKITPVMVENGTAKFDLTLFLGERAEGLVARLEYNCELFEAATIRRMLGHLGNVLAGMGEEPERRLSQLSLLTEAERRQIVEEWNATEAEYPQRCLHELFEEQAERAPEAVAVVWEGEQMSYGELNRRANQLAHYLREQGVGPEVRVGICMPRSVEMVVGQLGILKAGGAYVPLDAEYPVERLQYMIADMGGAWVLTQERVQERVRGAEGARLLCLDRDWAEIGERPGSNLPRTGSAENLAYVIYTSGSTGQPKGVMVSHRNLNNLVQWHGQTFGVGREDRGSCVAGLGFDASVWEVWPYLVAGASLALPGEEERRDGEQLQRWMVKAGVSVGFVPTVLAEQMLLLDWEVKGALRVLLTGGDRLNRRPGEKLGFQFSNNYGPTEATVVATSGWVEGEGEAAPSIGRPIGNTRVYVLDEQLQPVPVGIAGDLYIGGEGVSRGYLQRPELTAERFLPDPFAGAAGQRLYRTGDLARYRASGELEFMGRIDHQVKIRGFRIELGEIEAVLQEQAGVREAVVTVQAGACGDKELVAYVAAEAGTGQAGLRDALRRKLPEYMVPGACVFLERLPMTANGKVDREALPRAEMSSRERAEYEAPGTLAEKRMAGIWEEILGVERVGIHDNFFDLGGHSLQATKVTLRMREALQTPIAISELFHHPTIAELAKTLLQDDGTSLALSELPLEGEERKGRGEELGGSYVFPASAGQQRLWFLHELSAGSGVAYHVCGGLKLEGAVQREAMGESLNRVVARQESLRTRLALVEGELSQIIVPELRLEMGYEDVRGPAGERRLAEITAEVAKRGFDLRRGPLLRASLVRLEDEVYQLLIAAHHIICDGWSVNVFIGDLMEEYRGLVEGDGSRLEELPIQYADYAVWQRRWLESSEAEWEMEYWKEKLKGEAPLVNLPRDGVRPAMQSFRGGSEEVVLGRELGERLRQRGRAAGATMYMTLLSGFTVLLHKYGGQRDLWVGTPVANRQRRELEGLVGFFVNTLVLRTEVAPELSFAEVLQRVRETVGGAYGHQQLPFEKLVQQLHPQPQLSTTPLFQVMFAVEEEVGIGIKTGPCGLKITPVMVENGTAKFDLTLFLGERAEGLVARLEYNCELFEAATIRRMLGHLGNVLAGMGEEPERRLSQLSLLTEAERRQIVEEWNATEAEYPQRCLHELFEEQAERAPEAVAVVWEGEQMSYGELNRRANQLAHYLREQGVGPEVRVGICMPRSVEMVVGQLGILKAGGAYVPLDAEYPVERLQYMIADMGGAWVLTQERVQERVRGAEGARLLCLDRDWAEIGERPGSNLPRTGSAENLAYVIYTSGSTGQPKGVMVSHRNLNNLVQWHGQTFGVGREDRGSCVAGLGFDASVWEVWPYLVAGASLALPGEEERRDGEQLQRWMVKAGVSVGFVPTVLAEQMLLLDWEVKGALRVLLTGGDRLNRRPGEKLGFQFSNNYGPTEATVVATSGWVEGEGEAAPSIGRPIGNTRVYVLDEQLQPVPVGIAGDLYIGGEGVSRGYLQRPELTAERFLPDPFAGAAGQRLYRTGDLARYRASGELEFMGRIDHQVKIRGFRIELGEIEAVLQEQAGVREAVVTVQAGACGDKELVAYVAAEAGTGQAGLRDALRRKLPEYMVPGACVFLERLPMTANGKVDREALPRAEMSSRERAEYEAPGTLAEKRMAGIWEEILGVERVGIHDNFFDLGGHSLQATKVTLRMREALQTPIAISELFHHPTIAELAKTLLQDDGTSLALSELPLEGEERKGRGEELGGSYVFPASAGQQRLWFLHELSAGSGVAYHVCGGLKLEGAVQREAMGESLNRVVARQESLRTRLALVEGELSQIIVPELRLEMGYEDVRGPAGERRLAEITAEVAKRGFDLRRGPLLRASLVRLEDEVYQLLIAAHHIICDGWSVNVFIGDLMEEYRGLVEGDGSRLEELPIQYADYAVWQRRWLESSEAEWEMEYWKEKLKGEAPLVNLPRDGVRPAMQSFRGGSEEVVLGRELGERLRQRGRAAGATMYMTLLSGFTVLLHKYGGQRDLWVGTPVANRQRRELEGLVGFFVNTLVLRTEVAPELSFAEVLQRVRETVGGAYGHQQLPFEKLVQQLHPQPQLSTTPLFQVMFLFEAEMLASPKVAGLSITPIALEMQTAKFDLTLFLGERAEGLVARLEYNCELFEAATIRRMLGHLGNVLAGMGEESERRLSQLSLLTEAERRQIVEEWNATEAEYPQRCLHELFEEQAERAPEAVAVVWEGEQMSYGELNRRANQLAHYLREQGVGPEVRVGICMQRSLEMIAGLLGVLKAGGAYVPLDPGYPQERLSWMLEDGQVEVLLSEQRLQEQFSGSGTQVICMEQEWAQIERQSDQNPATRADVQNLAYVIYTSGSTGRPKGVAITHHSANVMVHWAREVFTDEELAGVLASTSICFDLSVFEIFVPLSWGGTVLLAENALELAGMPGAQQVRLINTVPSAMTELLRMKAVPSSVRTVNLAGEALQRNLVEQVYAVEQIGRMFNLYGPSEDTTYSTYEWVKSGASGDAVSIGRPIANTKVYVLDAALELVPVGVAGELYIGGKGQARGYLNRPELTAERFVPDPYSTGGSQRIYRTGDLARWNAEGSLDFLGRIDDQVKIRGYRIELGEIESELLEQCSIRQAVVVVHGSGTEQRLVAYVVAEDSAAELNCGELRENLREKVPGYMVPEVIVQLSQLPLTFNGKADRKKLPEPERDRDQGAEYVGPRNAEEEILCGIFAEVLKLESSGINDDFFQMGGHSLLATLVVSRIRSTFGVELPLSALFEAPTVMGLAERIKIARGVNLNGAPPLVAMKREGAVPLSYGQHRLWFIDQLEPGNPAYNIAFGVRLKGKLEREGLRWSLNEIVRRHESLRTSFPLHDGNPVQEIAATSELLIEELDMEVEEERQTRVLVEARREAGLTFDLGRGPLLRVKLLRVEEQDHVLLVNMHHIIGDGWSIGVLLREFTQLYQAWLRKEESPLPELKVQYADYTLWQREWLRGEVLESELAYWRKQLEDVPALELPVDHPRPAVMSYRGGTVKVEFSEELTERLEQLSRRQGVTLFMSVLTAFQIVLGRWAGQEDVAVGTGIANRNRRETEGLIGFFVNTLVLRTELSGNPSFIELLKRVQQVTLKAYQHQDIPFEKLVEGLHPERDRSRTPLFQAMLMFQNLRMPVLQLPGLRVSEFNTESETAKFDLMLTLQESEGTLNGELSYARDLYEAATMERLLGHVAEVLKRMVERPDVRIGEVSLLTRVERRQIVEDWNATRAEYPQEWQLQELIEQQVERSPTALAVTYEGQRLNYRELNDRANQLGCYLLEQGVGPDVRVGVCLERSVEMVVGLLGVLKAGGAYVPLDPDYPEERLKYMLADTQPALLLTQERMQARLAGLESLPALCLDRDWAAIAERPVTNLPRTGSVNDLAYVIYTSGSTGVPKGVMISHRGIVNRLIWMQQEYQLTADDRVLQKTPFSFDVSVWEFFWPLLTGAGLVLCQPGRHGDSRHLVELIESERVTTLHFVPSMLSQFLEEPDAERVSLRQVICSGEALPAAVQERFFLRMKGELHNLYGPTEASVDVTHWKCLRGEGNRAVPIGRPIANTQMYVLDQHLNAAPVGVKGDLYIGGVGLARGYQNRPELTAEKFIPDRLGTEAGQRLYKTGDLARYRADGSLEFLGRSDFQVKVRGFRIELGEIEGALQGHEEIKEAVVVARAGINGNHRLVAYLVASGESVPGISDLRGYLLERLPSYMVPTQFIALAQMPLGKNGKVDRRALPEPGKERPEIEEQYVEASSAEEKILAAVWRQVLGVEQVGVHDNFFNLGGDSIRSLQVITKARAMGLQITLQQLFQTPEIHGLAGQAKWFAEPAAPAEQPRPFGLIADNDRAKLQALLSRKNSFQLEAK